MIRYIEKGDIFRIEGVSSYAHGCNCAGAMGKGIAVQFKDKYPDMYLEYKLLCKENKFCPGDVFSHAFDAVFADNDAFHVRHRGLAYLHGGARRAVRLGSCRRAFAAEKGKYL